MTDLDHILLKCPADDAQQQKMLEEKYGLRGAKDVDGAVIFGAARLGAHLAGLLGNMGVRVAGFSDNDPARWYSIYCGLPVLPPKSLDRHQPVIIASKFVKDIFSALLKQGAKRLIPHYILSVLFPEDFSSAFHRLSADTVRSAEKSIREVMLFLSDQPSRDLYLSILKFRITLDPMDLPDPTPGQYFPGDFWSLSGQEVFVDVGACTGDTMTDFLRHTKGAFARYFALEPDPKNMVELKKAVPEDLEKQIVALPYGAGERRHKANFIADAGGESRISEGGALSVDIVSLDELLRTEAVSTIKIDVEGYEKEVLSGAKGIIGERSPKLAVSVYHKLQDIWELPIWIRACNGGYRFYLRHHTEEIYDTVLYCVPDTGSESQRDTKRTKENTSTPFNKASAGHPPRASASFLKARL
ncbi:MAG: FkbM family methyltransferase [Nitrospirae bacterium]|nr:FkbM family methyltransferase [Nitrospirota bacterium]